ncbi:cilia- and flagella-associated protein 65 isoform X3 [Nothobranchius furzeri]|uniref:cilia- and flagella-associated protein 65 isoform X3 n=1 Tax=Nothobranchius furzeri TaxID=105023 RepID=UPI003904DDCC
MATFDLAQFVEAPSRGLIGACRKRGLLDVADHFGFQVDSSMLKVELQEVVISGLEDLGLLTRQQAASPAEARVNAEPPLATPPPVSPAAPDDRDRLVTAAGDADPADSDEDVTPAEFRLRIEQLRLDAEDRAQHRQLEFEMRKLELEADTKLRLRKLELEHEAVKAEKETSPVSSPPQDSFNISNCMALMPVFRESEVDCYFSAFERIATALNWPRDVWPLLLQCRFTGMLAEASSIANRWEISISGQNVEDTGTHNGQDGRYQKNTSNQKTCHLGLETKPELLWDNWSPGSKFTKVLVLKNIDNKLKKLNIRHPMSNIFSASIPQIVFISPGTTFIIPITFGPQQMCEYEDSIEFQDKKERFCVYLHAIIPCHMLEVPGSVELPLCAVQHTSQTEFHIKNARNFQTFFEWDCAEPFHLSPERGLLQPEQECPIRVMFHPQEAQMHQQQACCRFGDEGEKANSVTVHLQGEAKYPYLELKHPGSKKEENCLSELHFGSVAVDQSLSKHFDIFNPSSVSVHFSLSPLPAVAMFTSAFYCDVTRGILPPGGSLRASVTYSPTVVDTVSVEYLSLKYNGSINNPQLTLKGKCIGPSVSLLPLVLDFGCVKERGSAVLTVKLINSSPAEAIYQWDIDSGNSVFSILPASGSVAPHSHIKLKAVYRPTQPIAYYRRVACLVLHTDPVFLDLIGTCHSELQRPQKLKPEHLVQYMSHYSYVQTSPFSDNDLQQNVNTQLDQQGVPLPMPEINQNPVILTTPMEDIRQVSTGSVDFFSSSSSSPSSPHVSVVPSELLFNHKIIPSSISPSEFVQYVTVRNYSGGKLRLAWTVAEDSPFSVSPSSFDLDSLTSNSFTVTYAPKQLNTLHGGQLECFVYQEDISDGLRPPLCFTVRVIGHSFQQGKKHFDPSCSLNPSQVVFPGLGGMSCQNVLLQNNSTLPLTFCLSHASNTWRDSLSLLPGCGLIPPGDHQIITIRLLPTEDSPEQGLRLTLQLNAAEFSKELTILSVAEKPHVSLESGSSLYFHPTAVGSTSQSTHHIKNISCLPIQFEWNIPETEQRFIFVKPDAGELHPNETSVQVWTFSPLAEESYTLQPTLNFWPVQSDGSKRWNLTLEVVGRGAKGFIEVENAVVDVGDVLYGSCRKVEIPLVNNSPCFLKFRLSVERIQADVHPSYEQEYDQSAFHLDWETGAITSNSTTLLQSSVRLYKQARYLWAISAQVLNADGTTSSSPQKLCEVQAKGVFPTLQVVGACSGGSVDRLSKGHVWKLLSLDSLNEHLRSAPSSAEVTTKPPINLHISPPIFPTVLLDFSFGSASVYSDPAEFVLMFHNPGSFPVDWAFLFPKDQRTELPGWAETGELSSTELDHMQIQDCKLFTVAPHSGTLLPGQKRAVQFSYSHNVIGTNRLPVVFKLSYGRETLLNFQGVTVEQDKPHLFASNQHAFAPVDVGDCRPPRQMYELYNGGAVQVHYEVDQTVLSQLQMDNFNHPVLSCISPQGEVLPGETATLEWIFSPLELKLYQMDVPIHIHDNDLITVRFEGCGTKTLTQSSSDVSMQREPFPGQVLFLSEDSVLIGDVPVRSQTTRVFFLTNVSHTESALFLWEIPRQKGSDQKVVQIHPERGRLRPEECTLCVLTFSSTDYPTIHQLDLICQVTQEAALVQYHDELQRWEEEKRRQENEFIITDKSASKNQRVLVDEKPQTSPVRKGSLSKYKVLPPISAGSEIYRREETVSFYTNQTRAERRLRREAAKIWRCPQPPRPALLHLRVAAHSFELQDYLKLCPDEYHTCFRNIQAKIGPTSAVPPLFAPSLSSAPGPGKDVVAQILTCMISDILSDPELARSPVTLSSKPRPYQPADMSSTHFSPVPPSPCTPTRPPSTSATLPQHHRLLNEAVAKEELVD